MLVESIEKADTGWAIPGGVAHHWEALARSAAQPNVFYEHWSLLPALRELAGDGAVRLLLVWKDGSRNMLLALLPLCVERTFRGLPLGRTALWRHAYCYLCTPLLHRDHVDALWPEIFRWIREDGALPCFTSLYWLGDGDAVVDALRKGRAPAAVSAMTASTTIRRATLHLEGGTYARFVEGVRTKKRKEWSRNWRRFHELGDVRTTLHREDTPAAVFEAAIERFLTLEDASWKGERRTSLLSVPGHARHFRELLASGHERGQAAILEITLDGESVGMLALLVSACGSTAYTWKIASSERHPQYSLGSQLVLLLTERAYAELAVGSIDSCAAEDHPMINRLWSSRREIVNLHFANGSSVARMLVPITDTALSLLRGSAGRTTPTRNDEVNEA